MSLPRYVINFEELVDGLFDKDNNIIEFNTGKQYSKGFHLNHSKNILSWNYPKNILINNIVIASTSKTDFGKITLNIYFESKLGKKSYLFDNVYIKDIYEIKDILCQPLLNISEKLNIELNNLGNNDNIFIDIDFLETK